MRAYDDTRFADFILRVGDGNKPIIKDDIIKLPEDIVVANNSENDAKGIFIRKIYPDLELHAEESNYVTNRAILATTNAHVDSLNEEMIKLFPGESTTFISFDQTIDDTNSYYQEEFLNSLLPNGIPQHKLILKVNCPIMLLRNLDPSNGLCNGTRLVC
ncbi:hypothetical protein IC582_007673 [Cucumis melo]|uniref:Uncharacterized protein LOC103495040 n=1 Tax=Cucumis melo TaxID=3656 RepID=A0A1S3BZY9_CUCME|nr:uncharacterized protein LOC103495040 [Cucumis melo]